MASSVHLFELIHSLSQSEKRYFKIFSSSQSGNKVYVRLFNAIARQKKYDEKKLKEKLKIRAFAVAKKYLNNLVMRSLRSQKSNQNVSIEINDLLKDVEILFHKGFYTQCNKLLLKAKKIAETYEKHPLLMEIYQLEHLITNYTINVQQHKRLYEDDLKEVSDTIKKYWEQMEHRRIINLIVYKRSLFGKLIRSENDKKEIYQQARTLLNKKPGTLLSYKAGIFHHNIKQLYYYSIHDIKDAYRNCKEAVHHMESKPMLLKQEINNYMNALSHLIEAQIMLHNYEEIKSVIDKLKSIEVTSEMEKARVFGFCAGKEIIYFVRTNRHSEGLERAPLIEKQLLKYSDKISKPSFYEICASMEELYFICGKFRQALQWNNKILNDPQITLFYGYYSNARISEIIIHYELKNADKVLSLVQSYYQFLIKRKGKYEYEKKFIHFFKNLMLIKNRKELKNDFINFRKELLKLENNPYEKEAFDFFDLITWLESKIENRPFATIMKEKMEKL